MKQTISYDNINEYIYDYLSYVIEKEEIIKSDLMDDDKYEEILFKIANNWENGYDIIDWFMNEKNMNCSDYLNMYILTDMYKVINNWYIENYGDDSLIDWRKLSPEYVVRHYLYYFVNSSPDEIKEKLMEMV